jgi:hypothetical protein
VKYDAIIMVGFWLIIGLSLYFIIPLGFVLEERPWAWIAWVALLPLGRWAYNSLAKETTAQSKDNQ